MNFEEYERGGQHIYATLATTVAAILTAAIDVEGDSYRLQQVKARAKQPASLRRKLEQRGIAPTSTLETDIKDLAGCRIIFYTNTDVTGFVNSGIVQQNFEVLDVKIHHPRRAVEDAADLYTSSHYLVALSPERIALPEYARFAGMRCEIQIQTILNHAWAEMAHDTIYKAPDLANFGGKAFDDIKARMRKVAQRYLVPAGYEFQKIASDFQRLLEGKTLFDGDAVEAIVEAADNNARAEAIEKFAENVLPFYDDLQAIYPEIIARLLAATDRARAEPPVAIQTPYGALPAKTSSEVILAVADILRRYRYLDIGATFDALCKLYGQAENRDEERRLLELGKELAKHEIHVWRQHGPIVQALLLELIEALGEDEFNAFRPLLTSMLGEILGTEVRGTTSSSSAVTLHRGAVVASDQLRAIRTNAIDLLKRQFALAETDDQRRSVLQALEAGTRLPYQGGYSNTLQCIVLDDIRAVIEFQTEIAPALSLESLRKTEVWVHRNYWNYANLPERMGDDPELVAARTRIKDAALAFRDLANAMLDFVIYKTLIGYDSVLAPAWHDEAFRFVLPTEYRAKKIDELVASVDEASADLWFDRISRYARTESDDLATFPEFAKFLERLAEAEPAIALEYFDLIEAPLARFLPNMLSGLMRSAERANGLAQIDAWLDAGQHIEQVAWHLRFADPFCQGLLRRTLDSAIQHYNAIAVGNTLLAAANQFAAHPGTLVDDVFLPALRYLHAAGDFSWLQLPWVPWLDRPIIRALNEKQAGVVLDALVCYPRLESSAEHIVATIAARWPASVVAFLGERQVLAQADTAPTGYDAIPYSVHELKPPLAAAFDIVLEGARAWFDAVPQLFIYDGGRLLASVFPDLSVGFEARLGTLIAGGKEQDLAFALSVLSGFEGRPCIYGLMRKIVAALDPRSSLLQEARSALRSTGVVRGAFGFAELYAERKALLEQWLIDPSEQVRQFAAEEIHFLVHSIAAENRSAEASIALRKLDHGEELDIDEKG